MDAVTWVSREIGSARRTGSGFWPRIMTVASGAVLLSTTTLVVVEVARKLASWRVKVYLPGATSEGTVKDGEVRLPAMAGMVGLTVHWYQIKSRPALP